MEAIPVIMQEQQEEVEKTNLSKTKEYYTQEEVALLMHILENADKEPRVRYGAKDRINWVTFHKLYMCLAKASTVYRNSKGHPEEVYYYREASHLQHRVKRERNKERKPIPQLIVNE